MTWRRTYSELSKSYNQIRNLTKKLDDEIKDLCEFEVGITYCEGDGILVIDIKNATVAVIECLAEATKKNKLTREEFERFSI
jgi:hypothetical protein